MPRDRCQAAHRLATPTNTRWRMPPGSRINQWISTESCEALPAAVIRLAAGFSVRS